MGDNGVAGPPAKKRVASRQLCKDDGSDAEGEAPPAQESGGAFQKASEEVMAARRIVKVRRSAAPAPSAANPFAGVRLIAPSSAAGEPAAACTPFAPAARISSNSPDSVEAKDSSPVSLVRPTFDSSHPETELGTDHGKSEQVKDGNLDVGAVESAPREVEEGEGRVPGTENVGDAVNAAEDKTGAGDFPGTLEVGHQSSAAYENRSADQVDGQGEEKQGGIVDRVEKGDSTDQAVSGFVEDKEEKTSEQTLQSSIQAPNSASSNKTGFASSLGLIGSGFSSSSFSFGTAPSSFGTPTGFASFRPSWAFSSASDSGLSSVSAFSFKTTSEGAFSTSSSAFGDSNGGTFQLFGAQSSAVSTLTGISSSAPSSTGSFSFQEVPLETGEEQEKVVFAADGTLFEFADGAWRERGKGEIKVNVPEDTGGRSRLLMRSKGNYRLLLNASLFPDIKMASMDSRGVTFACVNSAGEGKSGLTTYAVKLKDSLSATGFREAVDTHKGKPHVDLKTPENSPRAPHETGRETEASEP